MDKKSHSKQQTCQNAHWYFFLKTNSSNGKFWQQAILLFSFYTSYDFMGQSTLVLIQKIVWGLDQRPSIRQESKATTGNWNSTKKHLRVLFIFLDLNERVIIKKYIFPNIFRWKNKTIQSKYPSNFDWWKACWYKSEKQAWRKLAINTICPYSWI